MNKTTFHCDISICNSMCCRNCPVLTQDEVAELIANVKKKYDVDLERKRYFRSAKGEHGLYFSVKMIKGQCIFLNREKRCRIYDCRPTLCELYPAIDVDAVDERCPGIQKNEFHEEMLDVLKKRYAQEIDERIKKEHTFMFV
ncbi:MAG: YkgJ family cysteine cluster protein [Candidatus Methanoperedens sp.]|nr:YkgJ family cysteine cluster protein [Candidatus Methanoperedens sp.]MCE8424441.1 YkgJ family cysteine cluster protein [Candidatus Methanoperedens sp.]MCE8427008.1 YkgJ family cysteine cluster protein [Candidatus Methanoperedens sp.]